MRNFCGHSPFGEFYNHKLSFYIKELKIPYLAL